MMLYRLLLHFVVVVVVVVVVAQLDKSNSTFNQRFWFWKMFFHLYYLVFTDSTIKRIISYFPFNMQFYHLFVLITFFILNSFWFVFCSSFSKKVPIISSPLRPLIAYVHGTLFLNFLITKASSDQFGA